ncbi:MAG TPA: hypothetical protein VFO10_22775 [Oligoflexus sp.]|uniref:DoxX family protein n=1 Tax=Oligoflexus sp. TaxID=1971216 RepID=UPI002D806E0F|nr:hypothetical protein [Oligoflexus sp.]HET9240105.1 hypothetical protein [Oligoflexus sp.]
MEVRVSLTQKVFKILLGLFLFMAGVAHLTWRRTEFLAQVPPWLPLDADLVVLLSGWVEISLGLGLLFLQRTRGAVIGVVTGLFFIAIFPGNISQYVNGISAFRLDTDRARLIRLFFQPVLVAWALWSTGGWTWLKQKAKARSA